LSRLPCEEMEQVLLLWLRPAESPPPGGPSRPLAAPSAAIVRAGKPQDWKALATAMIGETTSGRHLGQAYERAASGTDPVSYFLPDGRTIIVAAESDLRFLIAKGKGPPGRHPWDGAWKDVEKGEVTIALGSSWLLQRAVSQLGATREGNSTRAQ